MGVLARRIRGKDTSRVPCIGSLCLPLILDWDRRWFSLGSYLGFSSPIEILNFYSALLPIPTLGVITSWWMTRNLRSLGESLTTVPKRYRHLVNSIVSTQFIYFRTGNLLNEPLLGLNQLFCQVLKWIGFSTGFVREWKCLKNPKRLLTFHCMIHIESCYDYTGYTNHI